MVVTRDYFDVVGVRPLFGRTFTEAEASRPGVAGKPGAPPTAILLGHDLWQREFGGDPAIVGKTVTLSRMPAPLPVVGVMPPGLRFLPDPRAAAEPNYDLDAKVDFWLAMTIDETTATRGAGNVIARLRDGATAANAQAEVAARSAAVAAADPRLVGLTATARPVRAVLNARRRAPAGAAVRRRRPALPHRLRQRQRPAARARPAAPAGVRDTRGDGRQPVRGCSASC